MGLSTLTALTRVALIADVIALWAYRRDANTAVLQRLVPSMLVGVCLGAPLRAVSAQAQMRRVIGAFRLLLVIATLTKRRWWSPRFNQERLYGTLAGITTVAVNADKPMTSMHYLASRFSVSEFPVPITWSSFTAHVIKAPFAISLGLLRLDHLSLIGTLGPVVLTCAWTGSRLAAHIPLHVANHSSS